MQKQKKWSYYKYRVIVHYEELVLKFEQNRRFMNKNINKLGNDVNFLAIYLGIIWSPTAKRARFGLGGKISGTISSIYEIKQLWKGDPENSHAGYNKIFIANHGQLNIEDLTGKIVLSQGVD